MYRVLWLQSFCGRWPHLRPKATTKCGGLRPNMAAPGRTWRPPAANSGCCDFNDWLLIRKMRFSAFQRTSSELCSFIRSHFIVKKHFKKRDFYFFWAKKWEKKSALQCIPSGTCSFISSHFIVKNVLFWFLLNILVSIRGENMKFYFKNLWL